MCRPSCRTHIHLHPLACSWAFHHGLSSSSSTSTSQEYGTLAKTTSSTGYEPNVIDNSDYSETTEIFIQESSSDSKPSDLHACGQCLIDRESRRKFIRLRLDALCIPDYVIKKGLTHGARHGKTEVQREYHLAWNAWKRCCKTVDSQGEHFTGIHDRLLRDPIYRGSQLAIGWTEKCKEWDELAKEGHTYHLTLEEKKRYQGQWYLTLNKEGNNGPVKLRCYFRAAVLMKNRLHHELGEQIEERLHPDQQRRSHSSSNTSWWDKSGWNWKWAHKFSDFSYSWFRVQSIAIHCNRRVVWTDAPHWQKSLMHMSSHVSSEHCFFFCLLPFPLVPLLSLSLSTWFSVLLINFDVVETAED